METFFNRLIELKGTQSTAAFARSIGIPQPSMDRYLKGRVPTLEVLKLLCSVYNVSADWLLGLPERGGSATVRAGDGAYPPAQQPEGAARRGAVSLGSGNATASNCRDCPILLDFINRRSGGK